MEQTIVVIVFLVLFQDIRVEAHGRLVEPPGRSTAWRFGFGTPTNYNDNQLSCGGAYTQHVINKGKCGVCGDDYRGPLENQPGPDNVYATGTIVANYTQGQVMQVKVELTAQHQGYFEFRLCPHNDPSTAVTHECLNENLLKFEPSGATNFGPIDHPDTYILNIRLPPEIICTQCVLQWKYRAGNSWGCKENGECCVGCGAQEEFYGCADIAVRASNDIITTAAGTTAQQTAHGTTGKSTTAQPPASQQCTETAEFICPDNSTNIYPDPCSCSNYYQCAYRFPYKMPCPSILHYNSAIKQCDYPENTQCTALRQTTQEQTTSKKTTTSKTISTTTTQVQSTMTAKPAVMATICDGFDQFVCSADGLFSNPCDCNKFIQCANGRSFDMSCPAGLHWNAIRWYCDWPDNVECIVRN